MRRWSGWTAVALGAWLSLGGAEMVMASCPGGGGSAPGVDGAAYCPPEAEVAGIMVAAPAGPLAVAALGPSALGPGYTVVDEWAGGEVFYGVLAEAPQGQGTGAAVLQTVQRLASDEEAARFFPVVATAAPSDVPVLAQEAIGPETLGVVMGEADEVWAAARVLASGDTGDARYGAENGSTMGVVVVARKNEFIVSVEVRGAGHGVGDSRLSGDGGPAAPRVDRLLRALLARLPG